MGLRALEEVTKEPGDLLAWKGPRPTLDSGLLTLPLEVPRRSQKEESGQRGRISRGCKMGGRGSAWPDSRLGGVERLAVTVTQVSVGSQGQPAGRSPDQQEQASQLQLSPQLSSLLGMQEVLL